MQHSQLPSPPPPNNPPPFPQTLYIPNNSYQQTQLRYTEPHPIINNQNTRPFTASGTYKPVGLNEGFSYQQPVQNSVIANADSPGFGANRSSLRQTRDSKYKNKFSFKKNPAFNSVGPLASSFNNYDANASLKVSQDLLNQSIQVKSVVNKQQFALAQVRDVALRRRSQFDTNRVQSTESIREVNDFIIIYNLTLVNLNTTVKPLDLIGEEILRQESANGSKFYQPIYQESIPNLPAQIQSQIALRQPNISQTYFIPQAPSIPSIPIFVPAQTVSQSQPAKAESQIVYTSIDTRSAVVPIAELSRPNYQSEVPKYETYQAPRNEPTQAKPSPSESFKYQPFLSNPVYNQTETTYESYQKDYKPYVVSETKPYNSFYPAGGNALNVNQYENPVFESAELRSLRSKVEQLEQQKSELIDKIRAYEKGNNFQNLHNEEIIQNCQQEISKLKAQIAELTVIYNNTTSVKPNETQVDELKKSIVILEETMKQYEQQLIQAQNHIIYLENSRNNEDINNYQTEIKYLRETIAKYTEHIEQIDIQRRKFEELLAQRDNENQSLAHEVQEAHQYIQTLQQHMENNPGQGNGVSYEIYQNLIVEYGRKELQVIILLEEINRLNTQGNGLKEHLQKAQDQINRLQEDKQHEAPAESTRHEKVANAISQPGVPQQEYGRLLVELRNREQESILLNDEINKLNERYNENREHLEKAEEYIIHLQETYASQSPVSALIEKQDTQRSRHFQEQIQEWQTRVSDLQTVLKAERLEKEGLIRRSVEFKAEYDDMEYRFRNALDELGRRYDQLLQERNSITVKLVDAQNNVVPGSFIDQSEVDNLQHSLKNLTQQLQESQEHLITAESYIESNAKNWEQSSSFKERHNELQNFVTIINSDLQKTKKQNQILAGRIQHLQALVSEVERLKVQNQQLTIVIREKDNSGVSTSLKQIDEVQETLTNYTRLYNQSELRVRHLQQEKQKQLSQITQLEEYLTRAQSFIIEQESIEKKKESNVAELSDQLIKSEEHIFSLEKEYDSLLKQKDQYEKISRDQSRNNADLYAALQKAEAYIIELETKTNARK